MDINELINIIPYGKYTSYILSSYILTFIALLLAFIEPNKTKNKIIEQLRIKYHKTKNNK